MVTKSAFVDIGESDTYKLQGNIAFQNKEYEKADILYSKAISIDEYNHVFLSNINLYLIYVFI